MNETERMKELVKKLNEAAKAYYQEDREIMSNLEYDTLYDELQVLEEKTGVTLAGSPTTKVGYEAMDELPKEAHESPMLSLDKTKDVEVLRSFIGDHKTLLSWKMDGLTVVLTYRGEHHRPYHRCISAKPAAPDRRTAFHGVKCRGISAADPYRRRRCGSGI